MRVQTRATGTGAGVRCRRVVEPTADRNNGAMTSTFAELEEQGAAGGPVVALSADIVDYSRLMADDMPATVAAMDDYHRLVDEKVTESGGVVANFVGDSFMAVFDDAEDAMQSAIAITTSEPSPAM